MRRLLLDEFVDQLGYLGRLLDDQAVGGIGDGDQRHVRAGLQIAALLSVSPISSLSPKTTYDLTPD